MTKEALPVPVSVFDSTMSESSDSWFIKVCEGSDSSVSEIGDFGSLKEYVLFLFSGSIRLFHCA